MEFVEPAGPQVLGRVVLPDEPDHDRRQHHRPYHDPEAGEPRPSEVRLLRHLAVHLIRHVQYVRAGAQLREEPDVVDRADDADDREQDLQCPAERGDGPHLVARRHGIPSFRRRRNVSSSITSTPERLGLRELRAGISSRDDERGLLETLDATRAPAAWASAVASSRGSPCRVPRSRRGSRPRAASACDPASRSSARRTPAARSFSISCRFSSSSNHSRTVAAISGPISGTASISSSLAAAIASIDPNARASTCATCVPTWRMFSPTSSRQTGRSFDALDLLEQVRDRLVLEARELRQLVGVERVDVGRVLDQALLEQPHHRHVAEVLDVHRSAPGEVEQPLEPLRRTPALVRAAVVGLALGGGRAACRTRCRSSASSSAARSSSAWRSTGPTISGITSPARRTITVSPCRDVLAAHLVLVVQRRVRDRDAADEHGLEHRERRDLARSGRCARRSLAAAPCAPPAGTCTRSPIEARATWSRARAAARV